MLYPKLTLTMGQEEAAFSFLDLLEITQEKDSADEVIELIAGKMLELTVRIETEKTIVEHIVLPTYRYIEQLLDMYSSPESLALSYNKKYILAEVLSKLGKKVNAELVLVDLRAGLSEFSAPLLFDPRVKKYLVTSTSYQSVKGTEILLHQLSKGLPLNGNSTKENLSCRNGSGAGGPEVILQYPCEKLGVVPRACVLVLWR